MNQVPYIPESAPFTAEQRAWLNGFLAGLYSNATANAASASAPAAALVESGEPLLILFGSQTGTAEGLAKRVSKESRAQGFSPRLFALNDYEQANLTQGGKALIICSTWGEGDPPDNAVNFWSWLKADTAPRLENLQFAVLGLGDRNYADFCGASKKFDARLEALRARRIVPLGECDVDYEANAKTWIDAFWAQAGSSTAPNGTPRINGHEKAAKPGFGKSDPFPARLLRNVLLNKPGSGKEVRHYEISLEGSGLTYEVGDALGIVPANCPELVGRLLAAVGSTGNETLANGNGVMSVREALTHQFDIGKPSSDLLAAIVKATPTAEFAPLLAPDRNADLRKWLWGRDVLDILGFLPKPLSADQLFPLLRKLAPRLYSISSSLRSHPGEVHLTVSSVRYESLGRPRKGVASTFLADRIGPSDSLKVFVQPSHGFKPPLRGETPMIMVGPGTGVAPFRAFLEERQATGANGQHWLFFGDQRRNTDFLYEEQLSAWQRDGFLTRLDLAFSRDQEKKVYVQDRMLENAEELWGWLEAGAHFYVCGDAMRMAKDVDSALHKIIEIAGGRAPEEAKTYVARLKSEKRYQRDVY